MDPRTLCRGLLVLALGCSAAPTASSGEPGSGPYTASMGLTGAPEQLNTEARAVVLPKISELRNLRSEFMASPRDDNSPLVRLGDLASEILSSLPSTPPDDGLIIQASEEVGATITVLQLFGLAAMASQLGDRIRGVWTTLEATHDWNPVLAAYVQGAQLRLNAMGRR